MKLVSRQKLMLDESNTFSRTFNLSPLFVPGTFYFLLFSLLFFFYFCHHPIKLSSFKKRSLSRFYLKQEL